MTSPLRRRFGIRNVVVTLICIVIAGTIVLSGLLFFADHSLVGAQVTTPPAPRPPAAARPAPPAQAPASAAGAAQPAGPVRTETITYDMWTVSCRDTPDGKTKKICSATLSMQVEQQNQRVTLDRPPLSGLG